MSGHPIPFAALDGKVGVMGVTGSGKTFTAIGLAEQLLEAGRQTIIIDPTGVYNGLRTAFPIPIFGGKFGDIDITDADGAAIAHAIIDGNLSAIVDVSLLLKESHAAARRFMAAFVAVLKTAETRARYVVMDEADEFMPENASGAVTQLFGDLKWIVRRGRSEGWRMLMVTQRPQDIAKSVLTQCETMVIHKLTSPQDRKALQEWVKGTADAEQAKIVLDSMAKLATGEAWVWSPVHDLLERVKMPRNRSEDRSKTPDADDAPRATLGFQAVDLDALRSALAKPEPDPVDDPQWKHDVQMADQKERQGSRYLNTVQHYEDRLAAYREQLEAMEKRALNAERRCNLYRSRLSQVRVAVGPDAETVDEQISSIIAIPAEIPKGTEGGGVPEGDDRQIGEIGTPRQTSDDRTFRDAVTETHVQANPEGVTAGRDRTLPDRVIAVLCVLASVEPKSLTEKQWATMAGVDYRKSTWRGYKAKFKDFVVQMEGRYKLNALGWCILPNDRPKLPQPGRELVEYWAGKVGEGARFILIYLFENYPRFASRAELAEVAGTDPAKSTFRGYIAQLNKFELIEWVNGEARIAPELVEQP